MADVQHSNLTGSAAVHPAAYVSSSDPGAVGANKLWIDTTTASYRLKIRNATNAAWVTVQNPVTTVGDIAYGGSGGSLTQLSIGLTNQVLTVVSGVPAWRAVQAEIGANLMLARSCF